MVQMKSMMVETLKPVLVIIMLVIITSAGYTIVPSANHADSDVEPIALVGLHSSFAIIVNNSVMFPKNCDFSENCTNSISNVPR